MAVHITIVVDNQASPGLTAEHGLSFWIEVDGKSILFDAGQGCVFANNAQALGIDLHRTDAVILSHGHYDHTGGIPWILQAAPQAVVYAHPSILKERYSVRDGDAKPVYTRHKPHQLRSSRPASGLGNRTPHPVFSSGIERSHTP